MLDGLLERLIGSRVSASGPIDKPLSIRVMTPSDAGEERVAGDFFSDEVARALAFGGTREMTHAVETLQDLADRLDGRSVALHANLALGRSVAHEYKSIADDPNDPRHPLGIKVDAPAMEEARTRLSGALADDPNRAAESLGHIRYRRRVESLARWLAEHGDREAASEQVDTGIDALAGREVDGRPVRPQVLDQMRSLRDSLRPKASSGKKKTK